MASIFTTEMADNRCPYCDGSLDAASHMREQAKPKKGDFSVCIYCAQLLRFDELLAPRKLLAGEAETVFLAQPKLAEEIRRLQAAIRETDRRRVSGVRKGGSHGR
jgi:hypothetical protein